MPNSPAPEFIEQPNGRSEELLESIDLRLARIEQQQQDQQPEIDRGSGCILAASLFAIAVSIPAIYWFGASDLGSAAITWGVLGAGILGASLQIERWIEQGRPAARRRKKRHRS